jgi:hypothetical protein
MDNRNFYQAAVLGGTFSALTTVLPILNIINCFCCIGIAAGGAASVLYLKKYAGISGLLLPEIMRLGIAAGIVGAFFVFIVHFILYQIAGNWQIEFLINIIENMEDVPPAWEEFYNILQEVRYEGFGGAAILIPYLILFPLFNFLGALITNQIILKKSLPGKIDNE